MTCSSDWLRLNCGDRVHSYDDESHVARVEAILHGSTVRVVWDDTGWLSDLPLDEVVKLPRPRGEHDPTLRLFDDEGRRIRR